MIHILLLSLQFGHFPAMVVIGIAVFLGTVGGRVFERLRIPQVVGNIVIGLLLGQSVLKLIDRGTIQSLEPFNYFALGVIGFLIGGELHRDIFIKHGRRFMAILIAEGVSAFLAVGILVGCIAWIITRNVPLALSLGVVLGAISSATAPAATVNVLWEYKTRGPLTTTIFAVVALDDALALILFSFASGAATLLMGLGSGGVLTSLGRVAYELIGGAVLGAVSGIVLNWVLRRARDRDSSLAFIIGALALVIGVGRMIEVDTILSAMALGFAIVNLAPRRSDSAFRTVESFAPPIFVLFFVSVGAQLNIGGMAWWMWILAFVYVVGRTVGKFIGSDIGSRIAGAAPAVRKYLGMCLFSQAGVAVGLSISAGHRFSGDLGAAIVMIIALTTFIVQIIGPPSVRHAVKKAGEVGMRITEEDLFASYRVSDLVKRDAPSFKPNTPLERVLDTIAGTDDLAYPVIDAEGKLLGIISFQELRRSFISYELHKLLVAYDMMEPAAGTVTENVALPEAVALMRKLGLEYLPVVSSGGGMELVGMLEQRAIQHAISREMMRRQQLDSHGFEEPAKA